MGTDLPTKNTPKNSNPPVVKFFNSASPQTFYSSLRLETKNKNIWS